LNRKFGMQYNLLSHAVGRIWREDSEEDAFV
jgi:hypothetical protein